MPLKEIKGKSKKIDTSNKELKDLYKEINADTDNLFKGFLAPSSYTVPELIEHAKEGKIYRPLAKSYGLV